MFKSAFVAFTFVAICLATSAGYNYLLAVPMGSKSLHALFSSLGNVLLDAHHQVTLISSFKSSLEHENYTHYFVKGYQDVNVFSLRSTSESFAWFSEIFVNITNQMWTDESMHELWRRRHEFHGIVIPSYLNECAFPFLVDYPGAFIMMITSGVEYVSIAEAGHRLSPAVIPSVLLQFDERMTFLERMINLPFTFGLYYYYRWVPFAKYEKVVQKYFPEITDLNSFYQRHDLLLINGHFLLETPMPLLPNQVEIGTINAHSPKPLAKDLQEFLDGADENGVIYFSLGSIALSSDIPVHSKEIFVEAFRQLPHRVIWKYEGEDLLFPPNVLVRKWLPQQDILGHPNTRVFISHCGNLATQEAKYHGVPILAVPVAFDQPRNAARMVRKGYGIAVTWEEMSVQKIVEAVNILTRDQSYRQRLQSVALLLRDQKESAAERALWWVEYVTRHNGSKHLQFVGKEYHLLQYLLLDVILVWLLIVVVIVLLFVRCFRFVLIKFNGKIKRE